MKRVIKGKSYNTETSSVVGRREYVFHSHPNQYNPLDGSPVEATLFVTRGGALFWVYQTQIERETKVDFETTTREEVAAFMLTTSDFEVIDASVIGEPDEAEAEEAEQKGETVFVRLPATLRNRMAKAAEQEKLSMNAWAMRCFENCLSA